MSLLTYQPFKAVYIVLAIAFEALRLPWWVFLYSFRSGRPKPTWTFREALAVKLLSFVVVHNSAIRVKVPLSLKPGPEKDRFTLLEPGKPDLYTGPMLFYADTVKPTTIGATWYPRVPSSTDIASKDFEMVLHLHGGAYVVGNGRKEDTGYLGSALRRYGQIQYTLFPQYRLSGAPTNASFPAALQDALTTYLYLTQKLNIPAKQIVISGDSAGGNLTLAFLKYLSVYGEKLGIEKPKGAVLWSPWVSPHQSLDWNAMARSPNYAYDYLRPGFGVWGGETYIPKPLQTTKPDLSQGTSINNYISFHGENGAFEVGCPVLIVVGEVEILCNAGLQLAEELKKKGNTVEVYVQKDAVHDVILMGKVLGFEKEVQKSAQKAGEWIKAVKI
jgi:acetyl esterase/lipase